MEVSVPLDDRDTIFLTNNFNEKEAEREKHIEIIICPLIKCIILGQMKTSMAGLLGHTIKNKNRNHSTN